MDRPHRQRRDGSCQFRFRSGWREMRVPLSFLIAVAAVVVFLIGFPGVSSAGRDLIKLTSRYSMTGDPVSLAYMTDYPEGQAPAAIILMMPGASGFARLKKAQDGKITHGLADNFYQRSIPYLADRNIGLAVMDVPSDRAAGLSVDFRKSGLHRQDMKAVIQDLRKRNGSAKLFLAGTGSGCVSVVYGAREMGRELNGIILAGADVNRMEEFDFSSVTVPVLVVHHVDDGCGASPAIEAGELARKHRFAYVPVEGGDSDTGRDLCGMASRHGFRGSEKDVSGAIAEWIEGKAPGRLAPPDAAYFLNEQVHWVPAGDVKLQTTVYRPDGKGPFPLIVMNHGVPFDKLKLQLEKYRHRLGAQSREFVKRGFVVAIPMRRGFGKSGGAYNDQFGNLYAFGLTDARDIRAVVEYMKGQPGVDGKRLVMLGQSGGGLASLAYGSLEDPSLLGIINFAGGIKTTGKDPWEQWLVAAFATYAKTTKVPSLWFYAENDSYFPPGLVRTAHEAYVKNGGRAKLLQLPAFKKDGHGMFYDSDGIPLWTADVDAFLTGLGIRGAR